MSFLPIIQQALLAGFGEKQILGFLAKRLPTLAKGINKASSSGFDPAAILRFIAYSMPKSNDASIQKQQSANDSFLSGIGLRTKEEKEQRRSDIAKKGLGLGAAAIGAYHLLKPNQSQQKIGPAPMSNAPVGLSKQSTISPSTTSEFPSGGNALKPYKENGISSTDTSIPVRELQRSESRNIGQGAQPLPQQQEKGKSSLTPNLETSRNSINILQQLGLADKINKLKKEGNTLEQIYSAILPSITPEQKEIIKRQPKELIEMVKDYIFSGPEESTDLGQNVTPEPEKKGLVNDLKQQFEDSEADKETFQSDQLVATPNGNIGTIKHSRTNSSLVESQDGSLSAHPTDSLISSPISEKDLAELHEDLIKGIEKETGEEVSRNVNWAGYDPTNNSLSYLPHGGGLYIYNDIPQEDVEHLTNILNKRKTTGENFIGAWQEGTKSPIGAAMSALIRKLQSERGGKGKEYAQKFETVYHYLEPAIRQAKLKKKKKK